MSLPSPAASPSSKATELDVASTRRKRQRSESIQSDSSSLKRAVSEGPRPATPLRATLNDPPAADPNDIDAYMAEQGELSLDAVTLMPPPTPPQDPPANLDPAQKFHYVTQRRLRQMQVGDTWYIVSRRWYRRWETACQGIEDKSGHFDEKDLGPVDNSPLVDRDGNPISNLTEGIDVEFVPSDVWKAFTTWYGLATHPLPRSVIARGHLGEPSLELRPPRLKVLVLVDSQSDGPIGPSHNYVTLSIKDTVMTLGKELVASVSARSNVLHRIWKIQPGEYAGSQFPASKLAVYGAELLEINDKTIEDALIEFDDPFVVEFQKDGKWIADQPSSVPLLTASSVPPPLFGGGEDFFSRLGKGSATTSVTQIQPRQVPSPAPSATSSVKAQDSHLAHFKSFGFSKNRVPQEPGTLGLGNMGNTCFMNSALQCLAHTKELTDYFLSGVYQNELNPDNPLGMGGAIAEAFGALLHRIWAKDSTTTSYSPREFKMQLQRFAPQFSGYQQHDSQELMAFLLDGLHEDLNRVLKKPYVEKPDWEGGGDLELAQLAQKSWHGYMQRNDSVIVDLFQGQYQSTLVCPECHKVSITFDPFMYLTLPLPMTKKWKHIIEYIPWDPLQPHVKVPVEIGRDSTFKELRALLGRWMGVPPENLLTLEIFSNRFYKNLDDNVMCSDMSDGDTIVCFELPCNARQSRLYKKKETDPFILPVFVTDPLASRQSYSYRSQTNFGHPFIVVVDLDQARSIQAIYEAVVDRLRRWTSHAQDLFTWEEVPSVPLDSVLMQAPPMDSLTEIKENGDVVRGEDMNVDEGDIADEKAMVQDDATMETAINGTTQIVGIKRDVFNLRFQAGQKEYGTVFSSYSTSSQRFESWETRHEEMENGAPLLKEMDALYCEFDENLKIYYFGGEGSHWEHARWTNTSWTTFLHPEYAEAKKAAEKKNKGLSIDNCLTEFTKEEQLGEDDLWYCPQCKKHQQATKKFDLWKVPDILAVHLKRFSNSRTLRDKIDTFVDFPIQGLDLTELVGERKVGQKLAASGIDIEGLGIGNVEEPLIYDLYAVDEHLGGLGGGHYRAYALNHVTEQWYHFDDSYVTKSEAYQAVHANAYLLFYKRRSNEPLGGKTHYKIEEALSSPDEVVDPTPSVDTQLPTPPNEIVAPTFVVPQKPQSIDWRTPRSHNRSTPSSSPPPLDELPNFEESQRDQLLPGAGSNSLLMDDEQTYHFPSSSFKPSPTSSNEVEPDDDDAADLRGPEGSPIQLLEGEWQLSSSSPSPIDCDSNPFSDANSQKNEVVDNFVLLNNDEIPKP
ncbi:cysteine proteinase [Boletus edulis]|nr:cysteine proteinase [Boletus edulis]